MKLPRIVFPESDNKFVRVAARLAAEQGICEAVFLDQKVAPKIAGGGGSEKTETESGENPLQIAMKMAANDEVDGVVAGIDFTTRDVILAARDFVGIADDVKTFCSLFAMEFAENLQNDFSGKTLILADGGVVKNPTAEQLADIIWLAANSARVILNDEPRVAILSFSTFGSGGKDETIDKIHAAIEIVKTRDSDLKIDGEMQLDAAVNPRVAAKKAPNSAVAGRANVLITPDLNSGNILYKSLEQFAGAHAYGPVLLGFKKPISDLSRGSTVADILGSTKVVAAQIQNNSKKGK